MKRTLQCAFAAAALLASSSAWAQAFGEKGQIAISAERLFGFTYDSARVTEANGQDTTASVTHFSLLSSPVSIGGGGGNNYVWGGYASPRVAGDYFVINRLSVGAALGYAHWSFTTDPAGPAAEGTVSGDSFTFAPRVGYWLRFADFVGFWPRGGVTYRTFSSGPASGNDFALTLEAPFLFTVIPHVGFWAGPTLDLGLTGSQNREQGNGSTTSFDFNATSIGIQTGMVVYFGT